MHVKSSSLEDRYALVDQQFDLKTFLNRGESIGDIAAYYRESRLGYRLFHSQAGSIHMALNPDGIFNESGYLRGPILVHDRMPPVSQEALELGSGNGYNLRVLSERLPYSHFTGVDLADEHVSRSRRALHDSPNTTVQKGDFHDLPFEDGVFDFAFSIESFCHALDARTALAEVRRVVSTGSRFVVIDAWRTNRAEVASRATNLAVGLTEKAMSVGHGLVQSEWLQLAEATGWRLTELMPLSREVMPNLERFERGGAIALRHSLITGLLRRALPQRLVGNVIAGYLMAQSVREGLHSYDLLVLEASPRSNGRLRARKT
jgi:ubiquinone/menaquinone biosynthesis C-methylase UbiE